MYNVTVFNVKTSKENPIEPKVMIVSENKLSECILEHLTSDTYCMVSSVNVY